MGNLLGAPVTDKETHTGSMHSGSSANASNSNNQQNNVSFGVSSMQGWRVHMEDAHIMEPRLYAIDENNKKLDLPGHGIFAVFDGHGGTYAAVYAGRNFCRVLSRQPKFVQYAQSFVSTGSSTADSALQSQRLQWLHDALCDAFVQIDKEIACALNGHMVPGADQPYHDDEEQPAAGGDGGMMEAQDEQGEAATDMNESSSSMNVDATGTTGNEDSDADAAPQAQQPTLQLLEEHGDSGTTACVVLLTPDWVLCANAGDSRAVMATRQTNVKNNNNDASISSIDGPAASNPNDSNKSDNSQQVVVPLSFDHKPDNEQEERRIRAAGGYIAGGRVEGDLAVSRGLGDFRFKVLDVVMAANSCSNAEKGTTDSTTAQEDSSATPNGNVNPGANPPRSFNMLDPRQAQQSNSINSIRRVLQPGEQKVSPVPDITVQSRSHQGAASPTTQEEFIIVACDGIWDVQTNYEAVKTVTELFDEGEGDLGLICEEVLDLCLGRGSKDNMTALVIKFESQKVGQGGGVLARRQLRQAQSEAEEGTSPSPQQ